ncbi:MAG: sigma-70 family RNA polymerase sigma factor [Phycisphaerales bacterium]|nr:MAG: sigma-70 family RNA polymerase sigma factor [Phycisphaerales bacterium]
MIDEKILVWKFNRGSKDALRRLYEKYKDDLLGLAVTLLRDRSLAEDVVHDVFVSFARTTGRFVLSGTLKGYLSTCVANCARDKNRLRSSKDVGLDAAENIESDSGNPVKCAAGCEQARTLQDLLGRLPYEQREIIALHLHQEMRFREIAEALGISINTVQSRYRYGLEKLRSILNSAVTK